MYGNQKNMTRETKARQRIYCKIDTLAEMRREARRSALYARSLMLSSSHLVIDRKVGNCYRVYRQS